MPYDNTIKQEAQYIKSLENAVEDDLHALYNGVLAEWFPTSKGFLIDHQKLGEEGKPEYVVVRYNGDARNALLFVELKRPSKYNDTGKDAVYNELEDYIEGAFKAGNTEYNTIYGLGGIGLNWMALVVDQKGKNRATIVQDWTSDITSDISYGLFKGIANAINSIS